MILGTANNILILSLDTLGDIVLRQPLFKGLLDAGHRVTVLVRSGYETIVPFLDERLLVKTIQVNPYVYKSNEHVALLEECRNLVASVAPDAIVCAPFQRTFLDEWILRSFSGCRRTGFNGNCYPYFRGIEKGLKLPEIEPFNHVVSCDEKEAEVEKNRKLLFELTGNDIRYKPEIKIPQNAAEEVTTLLRDLGLENNRFVTCCPAGTANVTIKTWPADRYAEVLNHIREKHGLPALLIGLDFEKEILKEVESGMSISGGHVKSWIGNGSDLHILIGLLASARMYLGNDTGPMHISAALGKPVLTIFGGGHWPRFLPAAGAGAVLTQELPCFYCGWSYCLFGNAPCVKMVASKDVAAMADDILEGKSSELKILRGKVMDDSAKEIFNEALTTGNPLHGQKQYINYLETALEKENAVSVERLALINERGGEVIALQKKLIERESEISALQQRLSYIERLREIGGIGWFLEMNSVRGGYSKITPGTGTPNLISVIIPVYNAEPYIEECIKSIWEQEPCGKEIEIIAVDDGSKDGSLRLLHKLAEKSPVVMKVIQHPAGANRGVSATRNLALNNANGEWVCMLDADDAWGPEKLKTQIEYADAHAEAGAICSYGNNVDTEGKPCVGWTGGTIAGDYTKVLPQYDLTGPYTFETLVQTCPLVNSSVMSKRQNFVEVGGYKENMSQQAEDWLMWTQLSIKNPIHVIKEPLVRYRIHSSSWTTRYCVEDLGESVKFEFFIELLYWMFTHEDENIRSKGHQIYKKYFPFFVKPVAKYFRDIDNAIKPFIGVNEHSNDWLNTVAVIQANAELEKKFNTIKKIPGYKLIVKVAKMVGIIKSQ